MKKELGLWLLNTITLRRYNESSNPKALVIITVTQEAAPVEVNSCFTWNTNVPQPVCRCVPYICPILNWPLPIHMLCVFSQKRNEAIDIKVWKPGREIPSAWSWCPGWNFLSRQTPVTSCFHHSFDSYPLLGFYSTYKPVLLGKWQGRTRLWQWESRETLLLVSKLLQGHTRQGRLSGSSQQELHCQKWPKGSSTSYRGAISTYLVLQCSWSSCPFLQWGFCHTHERAVQGPLEQAQALDQVWLALTHPAVWCVPLSPGGNGTYTFSF